MAVNCFSGASGIIGLLLVALLLFGCGGGGGGGGEDIDGPSPEPPVAGFVLEGSVRAEALNRVDSDTGDPDAIAIENQPLAAAQPMAAPALLGGFVAAPGPQFPPTRFGAVGDEWDYFAVTLQGGQQLLLEFPDPLGADLDLYLFTLDGTLLDASVGTGALESLEVPEEGRYLVGVRAVRGATNYLLRLDQPSVLPIAARAPRVSDSFVPGELILRMGTEPGVAAFRADQFGLQAVAGAPGREQLWRLPEDQGPAFQALGGALAPQRMNSEQENRHHTLLAIKDLALKPGVSMVSPNYLRKPQRLPDDPLQGLQWGHGNIDLPLAWDQVTGLEGVPVVVAVVDTGVFLDHEDLRTRLLSGYDFVRMRPGGDDPGDSRRRGESSWHGTHVAGIAAATTDNGIGIAGVSWGAEILPVRVLGEGGGTVYTVLQGVRWAAGLENDSGTVPTRPADVINLSLGGGGFAPAEQALFQEIAARGILVVAAAGNSASEVTFPAAYEGVFAVGATDAGAERAYYSSGGDLLDLVAPGGDLRFDRTGDGYPDGILSSVVDDLSGTRRSAYGFKQGTSMAAPMVSGVFALARSLNASLDANALRGLLEAGRLADDLGPPGWDRATGWGQINAARMVEAVVQDGSLPPPPPSVSVLPRSLEFGFTLSSLEFVLRAGLGGGARVLEIQGSAPWLEVAPTAVDALGLGAYRATLRRDALADGTYASALTVRFEGLPDLVIPVSAQVVTPDLASDSVGRIYVLLEDARGIPLAERALEPENGRYRFRFEGVAPGRYRLFGGSDMNGDFFICDPGEACGAYPTISLLEWFEVDGDRSDLDFSVGFRPFARSALEASVDRVAPRSRSGFGVEVPPRRVAR